MFICDEEGDLINMDKLQSIVAVPLEPEQDAPEGSTHELLAVTDKEDSYRLAVGTKESIEQARNVIKHLLADQIIDLWSTP